MHEVSQVAALLCILIEREPGCRLPHGLPPKSVATLVVQEAQRYSLHPWNLAAVLAHESGLNQYAVGAKGELGLGQLYRGTVATRGYNHLSDGQLMQPWVNIRLAARHLARIRQACGGWHMPVQYWIGTYSGRGCGLTGYGLRVSTRLAMASTRLLTGRCPGPGQLACR